MAKLEPSELVFRLLGPTQIQRDGEVVDSGSPKQRALLALLLLNANEVVSTDRILDQLWAGRDAGSSRRSLWVHVSNLRKVLEPNGGRGSPPQVLVSRDNGYALMVEPQQIDAVRFENLVEEARQLATSDPERAGAILRDALELWRGRPFEDVAYETFAQGEIRRLEELRMTALEDRLQADLALGRHREVIGEIEALVADDPLRESLWGLLMLALYRSGQQTQALRTYQRVNRLLGEEMGLTPSPELQRLEERILLHDPSLELERESEPRHNLPLPTSRFFGLEEAGSDVRRQLTTSRLVTLVGPGGVGKTSLAIETARSLMGSHRDGTWLVSLTSVEDPDLIPQTVAAAIGLEADAGAGVDALVEGLRSQSLLLVLDNAEHLLAACGDLAARVLSQAPGISLLVTSREPLGVNGERLWRVPPLSVPGESVEDLDAMVFDAVRLFFDRAASRDRAFRVDPARARYAAEICRRLDGIPLAVELAAAQVGILGVEGVAKAVADRFPTLETDLRIVEERHRSAAASIEWSYGLLSQTERLFFDRLSVFSGSFGAEAAAVVGTGGGIAQQDALGLLRRMLATSMVQPADTSSGEKRFRLLELLRQYGQERLIERGEATRVRALHCEYYRTFAQQAEGAMRSAERREWFDRIEADHDNFRTALAWSLDTEDRAASLAFLGGLVPFWATRGHVFERLHWPQKMLEGADDAPPTLRARALLAVADEQRRRGNFEAALANICEALPIWEESGDSQRLADALTIRACLALLRRDESAGPHLERALLLSEEADYQLGIASACLYVGWETGFAEGGSEAERLFQRALEIYRAYEIDLSESAALGGLARCALLQGDREKARAMVEEGIVLCYRGGAASELPFRFNELAVIHIALDDHVQAASAIAKALELVMGDPTQLSTSLALIAVLATGTGDWDEAATLMSAAQSMRSRRGEVDFSAFTRSCVDEAAEAIVEHLDPTALHIATERGNTLSEEQAIALGFELLAEVQGSHTSPKDSDRHLVT